VNPTSHSKLTTLPEAVRRFARDGMQYASGAGLPVGPDPVVFGRELLRQGRRHLHTVFHCNTQQLNLLAAAGAVSRAEGAFSGLEGFGFANGLKRRIESGALPFEDYSNLAMTLRYLGGALGWPFVPATVNIGSDIQHRSAFDPTHCPAPGKIPAVTDPFSGRSIGAFSPLRPELAVIHVTLADAEGNAIMLGTEWSRFELSRAARRLVLVADHIVEAGCAQQFPNLVRIPGIIVDAVVWWPFSAWPGASPGVHELDEAHMRLMNEWLGSDAGTQRYLERYVYGYDSLDGYLDLIGRDTLQRLGQGPTSFLLDPFRQWLLPPAAIQALTATMPAAIQA
jgi:glutaconate CoA-transferase subunit A